MANKKAQAIAAAEQKKKALDDLFDTWKQECIQNNTFPVMLLEAAPDGRTFYSHTHLFTGKQASLHALKAVQGILSAEIIQEQPEKLGGKIN